MPSRYPLDVDLIVVAGYSALMDFTLAVLPWTFLWKLQMNRTEKIGVMVAMSMGVWLV